MSENDYENIVIFVSDALRYDYVPKEVSEDDVIPTLAHSLHTPTSFASMFSGLSPENHNVRDFFDGLEAKTAFDFYSNTGFWDGEVSNIRDEVLGVESKDLSEMEPPFIWVERLMETHLIYGKMGHDRDYEYDKPGQVLFEKDREGQIDVKKKYSEGVEVMWEHFQSHIDELEERGVLDDTLVILTSDHGELLGERHLFKERYDHNIPPLRPIVQVPTIFYNHDVDIDSMRLIDVFPTALSIVSDDFEKLGDGVDARQNQITSGRNIMKIMPGMTFRTKWKFRNNEWSPTRMSRVSRGAKTLLTDLLSGVYNHSKNLERRAENSSDELEDEEEIKDKLKNLGYIDEK